MYQSHLSNGRERGWHDTYIHFYHHHQTVYIIVKVILDDLLIPTSMSCTITPTINYLIFMKTIINMTINTRYTQQYTTVNWVMGGGVAGLGPISNSPITTNSFSNVSRGKVSGIFRPRSMSVIINSYISVNLTVMVNPTKRENQRAKLERYFLECVSSPLPLNSV